MNRGALIKLVESRYVRTDLPEFRPGDTVRVSYKVKEGNRTLSDREIRRKLRADRKRIDKDRAAERAAKEEVQKAQEPEASQE